MPQHRPAVVQDAIDIIKLYHEAYQGSYPDPTMKDFSLLSSFLANPYNFWFVSERDGKIVGSVIYRYDPDDRLAKVYGGVIASQYRGGGLIKDLMSFGYDYLVAHVPQGVEVIYATTRTVHAKAQLLTENLGYRKLGIFPNVHKTDIYETHCLVAYFTPEALRKRFTNYQIHYKLYDLVKLASTEMDCPPQSPVDPGPSSRNLRPAPILEIISSPHFIQHRYQAIKQRGELKFSFFPFQEPNLMMTSPDQQVELFFNYSSIDGHTDFMGARLVEDLSYTDLFKQVSKQLRDYGARYIEILVRAHQPKVIESIMNAHFVPSAYLPAFQLVNDVRYDFVVMSRSFEMLEFNNIKLTGLNNEYLKLYFKSWKQISLNPNLMEV